MNAHQRETFREASKRTVEGENSKIDSGNRLSILARWARSAAVQAAARLIIAMAMILPGANLTPPGPTSILQQQTQPPATPEPVVDPEAVSPDEVAPQGTEPEVSAENMPEVQAGSEDWPMYMHDANHSARTSAAAPAGGTYFLQWAYSFGERVEVEAQPVTVAEIIYQGVMNGEMHAINALTGKKIWIARPGGPIPHTAAVADGRVIFGSLDGRVYALNAATGALVWTFRTGGPVVSAPAVVDGVVYIGSYDNNLYALDAAVGVERWHVGTDGPVVSSPAVTNGRVYFGSEDLKARAVDAGSGQVLWATQLYGQGMVNTHPIVSDDGQVTIWVTVKPGASSYVPIEPYPDVDVNANPVDTWDAYYAARPKLRPLYYLNAATGADLWQPGSRRYTPLPIPYWGLLAPALTADGEAIFPAPAGSRGSAFELDHDNRLFKVNLASGETSMIAGGPGRAEFQARPDEVGRFMIAGSDYLYSSSEDLAVFHMGTGSVATMYGDGQAGFYNIGSHMSPLSPLPSRHLWRYGGTVAMGGMPGGSVPIVSNSMVYYTAYSWMYAVGPTNKNLKPATSFPKRSARSYELTYPRTDALSTAQIQAEVAKRVEDILARGPNNPPMAVRWEQPGSPMQSNESQFEVFGMDYDLVRTLAEAYPFLSTDLQARTKTYLGVFAKQTILNPHDYDYVNACIYYGQEGMLVGDEVCKDNRLIARWNNDNPNLFGQRLYAIWAYANATGDWDSVRTIWQPVILPHFKQFLDNYNTKLGFVKFDEWRVGRLNIGAQIETAQAVRDMAIKLGDTTTKSRAQTLLNNLLNGRVNLANFVPKLYDAGKLKAAPIRLNTDGTIRYDDIMGPNSPYNAEMIPYSATTRNRSTDPSQVNWWDGTKYRVDAGTGFMYYQAMSGYYPMSSEMAARLRSRLLTKTAYYVKSYEVNNPWWWMADLAHSTTASGEHLYHSPTLSWSLFQVKARVQKLSYDVLVRQLPEAASFNYRYDLYRLQNLVTMLDVCRLQKCKR